MKRYKPLSFSALFILLLVSIVMSTSFGGVTIPFQDTIRVLVDTIPFVDLESDSKYEMILLHIRFPRVIVAGLVGAALAVSGVVIQSIFRNPMADPGIIGVSAGGAFGGVLAIFLSLTTIGAFMVPIMGFVCALLTLFFIYSIATQHGKTSILTLLLTGVAISSFLSACSSLLISYANLAQMQQMLNWLMGDLNGRDWEHVQLLIIPVLLCCTVFYLFSNELDILMLGEEEAQNVGMHVQRTRNILLILASLLTGVSVSLTGAIGFVGLVVPHMLRLIVGPSHKVLLPASMLGGAIFLILADLVARLIVRPSEIQIGIITAFFGAPFFIYLIVRHKRKELS